MLPNNTWLVLVIIFTSHLNAVARFTRIRILLPDESFSESQWPATQNVAASYNIDMLGQASLPQQRTEVDDVGILDISSELPEKPLLVRKRWLWRQNPEKTKKKAICYFKLCGF